MRLTQTLLQEYLEADLLIKKPEAKKAEVREAILVHAGDKPEFSMGDFLVQKTTFSRVVPMPVAEIRDILKGRAEEVLRETQSVRVQVRRVS